jgi:serine/threonine-protein kinase RsbW
MGDAAIRLVVPGTLHYRNVAVRVVAEACRLVTGGGAVGATQADTSSMVDLSHSFDAEFVSAFSEIFNNIVIHAYERRGGGDIEMLLAPTTTSLVVEIRDRGRSFDISAVPAPELDSLPEGGMGIHIARALVDVVDYEPGGSGAAPNVWRLIKYLQPAAGSAAHG